MSANRILTKARLGSLTDDIFAVAMTIMIFRLELPANITAAQLPDVLTHSILKELLILAGSFVILGSQWMAMHFQHGFLVSVDRTYCWLNIAFLLVTCVVPFSANLLVQFPDEKLVIYFYAGNLILSQLTQWATISYATRNNLNNPDDADLAYKFVLRRILIAPICYISGIFIASWSIPIAFFVMILPPVLYIFPSKLDKFTKVN
jgi:uncharacterized membrane protein